MTGSNPDGKGSTNAAVHPKIPAESREKGTNSLEPIRNMVIQRLMEKGMTENLIPAFIRNLENALVSYPDLNLSAIQNVLKSLGWDEFELDDHTLQLILALCEDAIENQRSEPSAHCISMEGGFP
jgi:hypothetical protein